MLLLYWSGYTLEKSHKNIFFSTVFSESVVFFASPPAFVFLQSIELLRVVSFTFYFVVSAGVLQLTYY